MCSFRSLTVFASPASISACSSRVKVTRAFDVDLFTDGQLVAVPESKICAGLAQCSERTIDEYQNEYRHPERREVAEFLIHEQEQFISGFGSAAFDSAEDAGEIIHAP